jgi:hypothetical protein
MPANAYLRTKNGFKKSGKVEIDLCFEQKTVTSSSPVEIISFFRFVDACGRPP